MDDLLREFLTETGEHLDTVDVELVRLERDPGDRAILRNVFRLVHTIKGTCGFLGLPRLEALAHAAEALMGRLRDGMPVTSEAVTLILASVDRIKHILAELDRVAAEPPGSDSDIIVALEVAAGPTGGGAASSGPRPAALRPGEATPEELERAFREAPGPDDPPRVVPEPAPAGPAPAGALRSDAAPGDAGGGPGAGRAPTIRVGVDTLEQLMTTVSELVLTRNQLLELARRSDEGGGFKLPLQRLSQVTAELQDGIMKTRMQPIGSAWAKLPRLVRDLSGELGKRIDIVLQGADTELDRQLLELVRDPLTHMVRNAADHGIEPAEERVRRGKPACGTIRLNAFHDGGAITIEMSDDGRGLDHEVIRRRAAELGLATAAELDRMTEEQTAELIFHPGFSTLKEASAVSGRGVGMDVVRTNIAAIGGTVEIASEPGRGTRFTIKIPLTLAIVPALIVAFGGQRFALPRVSLMELVRVRPGTDHAIERVNGTPVLRLRDELLPVVEVAPLFGLSPAADPNDGFVLVTELGRQRFGMMVEAVLETEEIVVKPMASRLKHIALFSGNTIMGDGAVVLILDPNGIARASGSELGRGGADPTEARRPVAETSQTETLLVFRGGDGALKALPLSLVTRLEEVEAASIESVGGQPFIQYRGRLMPLVPVGGAAAMRPEGLQPVIVVDDGASRVGLAVGEIVDVIETSLEVQPVAGRPDLVGSAIVGGRATEILDVMSVLPERAGAAPACGDERRSVLLVDDNAFFRDMLSPVLKAAGYRVRTAATAADAVALLSAGGIDMLVTDLDLPVRSGLDLVTDARRLPAARDIPVILLTSFAPDEVVERAQALGVHDMVAKFDRSGLLAALSEAGSDWRLAA